MFLSFFNQSPIDGQLGCFQTFPVINILKLIGLCCAYVFSYFCCCTFEIGLRTCCAKGKCICSFVRYCQISFHQDYDILYSHKWYVVVSILIFYIFISLGYISVSGITGWKDMDIRHIWSNLPRVFVVYTFYSSWWDCCPSTPQGVLWLLIR